MIFRCFIFLESEYYHIINNVLEKSGGKYV